MSNDLVIRSYLLSIIMAMSLSIFPFPEAIKNLNPDWVLLVLIYWALLIPDRVGVFNAWTVGILVDVLTGRLIGMHGLIYSLVSFICLKTHKRLRQYPLLQQSLFVFFNLLMAQIMVFWVENIHEIMVFSFVFWLPVFIGAFVWPMLGFILNVIRTWMESE